MFNLVNLLADLVDENTPMSALASQIHKWLSIALIVLMGISALVAIILVLMQPSNSSGIDALGGSSETFFGKNKGKSTEAKMKKWTWICLGILVVLSIAFYILQIPALWV